MSTHRHKAEIIPTDGLDARAQYLKSINTFEWSSPESLVLPRDQPQPPPSFWAHFNRVFRRRHKRAKGGGG
jgi:hypothetical protein